MFFIIFLAFYVVCFIYNSFFFKKKINYLNFFLTLFVIVILLSLTGIYGFPPASRKTYIYLFISLFLIEVFSIMLLSISRKKSNRESIYNKNEYCNKNKLLILSIIILVLMLPSTFEGLSIFREYGFTGLRAAAFNKEVYSTYTKLFFYYILIPANKAIIVFSFIEYFKSKKINLAIISSIINTLQVVMIFGARSILIDMVLIIVVLLFIFYSNNIFNIIWKNKKIILLFIAIFYVVVGVTSDRALSNNSSIVFNTYSYYVGSIRLLDVHIKNDEYLSEYNNELLYGKATFNPIFDISKIMIKTINPKYDYETGMEIINKQSQQYLKVSDKVKMNNNVTFLYVPLRDFGLLGLIIGPLIISLLYYLFYTYYKKSNNSLSIGLYCYALVKIPFLIFTFTFNETGVFLTMIFIIVMYLLNYKIKYNN